jgi:hypothetical protein
MQFSPTSYHFIPLRSKYSPQRPVLKHPQSMFLPWCQRPSCTLIQNWAQPGGGPYNTTSGVRGPARG